MNYIYNQRKIRVEWSIYKGSSGVLEDFSRAYLKVFIIGPNCRYAVEGSISDMSPNVTIDMPQGLPEGVYLLEAIWGKNWMLDDEKFNPTKRPLCSRDLSHAKTPAIFALTSDPAEENIYSSTGTAVVKVRSNVSTYGYDGLDAYQIAIMRGRFWGSEKEWMDSLGDRELINYYTKGEVDELIDNVEVDLSGYYTKEQTDTKISEAAEGLRDEIEENTDAINDVSHRVSTNTQGIADNAGSIAANTEAITENTAEINHIKSGMTTIGGRVDELETEMDNFVGLNQSNYMGMFPDVNSLPAMTEKGWAWVGSDMTAMACYVWFNATDGWTRYGSNTYDLTDYTQVAEQVATIGSKLGDLANLQTEDKTSLVNALNEVMNNASSTAENTRYVDNHGLGSTNVQGALDAVGTELYGVKCYNDYTEGVYIDTNNGTQKAGGGWVLSDFIPYTDGSEVRVVFKRTGEQYVACASFYNSSKVWKAAFTSDGYTNERTVTPTTKGLAYVRFGFGVPALQACEAYIDGKLVWNYTGIVVPAIKDMPYNDSYGIGAENMQDAIDKVGFVGKDTEIDLTQFNEIRIWANYVNKKWIKDSDTYPYYGIFIPVTAGTKYRITAIQENNAYFAFLNSYKTDNNNTTITTLAGEGNIHTLAAGMSAIYIAPDDAACMWVGKTGSSNCLPQKIEIVRDSIADYIVNADTEPTKDSSKLVTSGGVYNSIKPIDEDLYGKKIYSGYTEGIYIKQGNGTVQSDENWALSDYIPCKPTDTVRVIHRSQGQNAVSCVSFYYSSKVWAQSWTSSGYKIERTVQSNAKGVEYMRCGFWLPSIDKCEVYVNGELVWNYEGRIKDGLSYNDLKQGFDAVDINNRTYFEDMVVGYIIDARVGSGTFGQEIKASNTDWACTPYIDISKANGGIRYNWPRWSTSANYYGKGGVVFYDAEYNPLTEGVRLIEQRTPAGSEWVNDAVPEGAKYIRISHYASQEGVLYVSLYKLVPDNIFGLDKEMEDIDTTLDNTVYAEERSILRNARTSADTGVMTGSVGLLHFSDIHGDEGAAKGIRAFYDRYSSYITDMVSTGDVPYYYYSDGIKFYTDNNLTDALLALGNHDGAERTGDNVQGSADWDAVGAQVDYETYYAPYIAGWNVIQPTDAATNYLMYYYKDYTSASVRLIVLDVMHQDASQLQWLADTLADAKTKGYAVIMASHYIPNTYTEEYIVKKADGEKTNFHYYVSNGVTSIDTRFKLDTAYADAVETFIAGGGEFVIWLCGHYHTDYFTYSDTHPNILFCAINQAGFRRGGFQGYRKVGDHCANFVAVNKAQGLVKIYRIGLKKDKWLRPINVLTYDYVNKKVITNY